MNLHTPQINLVHFWISMHKINAQKEQTRTIIRQIRLFVVVVACSCVGFSVVRSSPSAQNISDSL